MLRFEILQAKYGDCFLLRWGGPGGDRLAVIDGGPGGVYPNLRRRLLELKGGQPTLVVDWAMVSHIDDDHINGLLAMMTELRDARDNHAVPPFRVRRFWFNSFEDLAGTQHTEAAVASIASIETYLPTGEMSHETQAVLASVGQGRNLRDSLDAFNLGDNAPIGGLVEAGGAAVDIDGLKVTIAGPLKEQLDALRDDWAKAPKARTAQAASYVDDSVANLSSLVCHVAFETGGATRTMLLTGDARGDFILEGLQKAGLMPGGEIALDLLKVQHHASERDVEEEFFRRTPAKHYVISANGKYDNPDRNTLKWLVEARGADAYTIHLSNQLDWMEEFFDGLKTGRNFEVRYRGAPDDKVSTDEIVLD